MNEKKFAPMRPTAFDMFDGWQFFNWDYHKRFYDVKLRNGDIIPICYPNAWKMHSTSSSNINYNGSWWAGECLVKLSSDEANEYFPPIEPCEWGCVFCNPIPLCE